MAYDEADFHTTSMAMTMEPGGNNARFAGDDKLLIQFHVLPMADSDRSAEEGRPIYKDVDHIRIMQPGNKESIIDRPITEMDKARFRTRYESWKAGEKELIEGTPLEAWPQVTRAQVEEMRYFNVRTVEQLAGMADSHAQQFMGINELRKCARQFLGESEKHAASTKLQEQLKRRDAQIAALNQALQSLKDQVGEMSAAQERKAG